MPPAPAAPLTPFALFDDARQRPARATVLSGFRRHLTAQSPEAVPETLAAIAAAAAAGHHVAAAFAYELGYALEPKLARLMPPARPVPLVEAMVFEAARVITGDDAIAAALAAEDGDAGPWTLGAPVPGWSEAAYGEAFAAVKDFIAAGDVYQINLTFPLTFPFAGSAAALFADLRAKARAGYGAFLRFPERTHLSLSPELFLRREGSTLASKPMKGTVARAPDAPGDARARDALIRDPKQRAENLMIVDLIRNDLARVCRAGSVRVPALFEAETYPTLHTMTSTVTGLLRDGAGLAAILRALFPCGSVTGAPKIRAMEIIHALEPGPRGLYCGAVGLIGPGADFALNVAIRTLTIEQGTARMGVGSGVVHDSQAGGEYAECLLKARFVTAPPLPPFALLETLRWTRAEGFPHLALHLDRMERSAGYFGFAFDRAAAARALATAVHGATGNMLRVRMTCDEAGVFAVTATPLPPETGPWTVAIAEDRIDAADPFIHHKTTHRPLYDAASAAAAARGLDELVFLNSAGRIAEGARTTVFVERDGVLLTPPLGEGALDGVLRRMLIAEGRAREAPLTPDDLARGTLFVGNALRGLVPARLAGTAASG